MLLRSLPSGWRLLSGLCGWAKPCQSRGRISSPYGAEQPVGDLPARTPDGNALTLLVRIAETPEARKAGLASVGSKALDATVLLYAQPKITTGRVTYTMSGIRAPLELAVIGELGNIVAIKKVEANAKSIAITERHRYMLAAKEGAENR